MDRINVKILSRSFIVILFYRLMGSGKFRLVLLLIVVMASSLLLEDIRSKVWQFVQGTSLFNEADTLVLQTCVFDQCLFTHWPYLTNNIMTFFDSISKVDLMQSATEIGT